jgi:hypothetical protein
MLKNMHHVDYRTIGRESQASQANEICYLIALFTGILTIYSNTVSFHI